MIVGMALAGGFCLGSTCLHADEAAAPQAYADIKSDLSLHLGEGSAALGDFRGNPFEAERAALAQARASLAESIQVRVSVLTSDTVIAGSKEANQVLESRSHSVSVVNLEDISTRAFLNYPEAGDLSVLAWITDKDYHAVLGARLDDSPHGGLEIMAGYYALSDLVSLTSSQPGGAGSLQASPLKNLTPFGLEFSRGPYLFGLEVAFMTPSFIQWVPDQAGQGGSYTLASFQGAGMAAAWLGYDWAPWKWRIQPYIPLRAKAGLIQFAPWNSKFFGAAAGLGLKLWLSNHVAIDLQGLWNAGPEEAIGNSGGGTPLQLSPTQNAQISVDGFEAHAGLLLTD
jgi:hypothetical protein